MQLARRWQLAAKLQLPNEGKNLLLCSEQGSPADGPRGLSVGDIVTGLEDCPVRGVEDWSSCLFHLSHTPQTGYCVPVASLQPSWAHGRGEAPPPPLIYFSSCSSYCDGYKRNQVRPTEQQQGLCEVTAGQSEITLLFTLQTSQVSW